MRSENRFLRWIRGWLPEYPKPTRPVRAYMLVGVLGGAVLLAVVASMVIWQPWAMIFPGNPNSSYSTGPITILNARLPTARILTCAVYDGSKVYIFGGFQEELKPKSDQIVIFDPVKETVSLADVSLPYGMGHGSAVWTGKHIYLFGGSLDYILDPDLVDNPPALDVVIRYDPSVPSIEVMEARLPSPRFGTSAVWDGEYAYIFGGRFGQSIRSGGAFYDDILRYDPSTDTIETMSAKLPTPREDTSAFFDGEYIYIIGGMTSEYYYYGPSPSGYEMPVIEGDILRYNPKTDKIETLLWYQPWMSTAVVWNGRSAYVFGGDMAIGATPPAFPNYDGVWEYTPGDSLPKLIATLPKPLSACSAVWDGQNAYIFGGMKEWYYTSDILKFTPVEESEG